MKEGSVDIAHTAIGFLFTGWSASHVYFRTGEGEAETVLSWGQYRHAWRCTSCDCTVLGGESGNAISSKEIEGDLPAAAGDHGTLCLNCRRNMAVGAEVCPYCGWTWKE
jgi:hypothetical protein